MTRTLRMTPVLGLAILLYVLVQPAGAAGTVNDCSNDTEFSTALIGGGNVSFNCGFASIALSSVKTITANTTIDGGNQVTLLGNGHRHFIVAPGVTLILRNITLADGSDAGAPGDGGSIINNGHLIIENSTIRNNRSFNASGGAIVSYGPLEIIDSVLHNNMAVNGGALYPRFPGAPLTISGSTIRDNQTTGGEGAGWGGAILVWDGANVSIDDSEIYRNTAREGGAVHNQFANSTVTVTNSTVRDNTVPFSFAAGGAFYNLGNLQVSDSAITGNQVQGISGSSGGGVANFVGGIANLNRVTLSQNSAAYGGGINNIDAHLTLTNSTISGNSAHIDGGGLYLGGDATITNATFASNTAGFSASEIYDNRGAGELFTMTNAAIAGVSGGNCVNAGGQPLTSNSNMSSDATCNFGPERDNVSMMLGPLADNGGFGETHLPAPGSPLIDAGTNNGCPPDDQRGMPRPSGLSCDVGSIEVPGATPTPAPSPTPTPGPTGTSTPTASATPQVTASPTNQVSATSTPAVTATPTQSGGLQLVQGNVDCQDGVSPVDSLKLLRHDAGLSVAQAQGCPPIGGPIPAGQAAAWGDVDCDGSVSPIDSLKILRHDAGLSVQQTGDCTDIGQPI